MAELKGWDPQRIKHKIIICIELLRCVCESWTSRPPCLWHCPSQLATNRVQGLCQGHTDSYSGSLSVTIYVSWGRFSFNGNFLADLSDKKCCVIIRGKRAATLKRDDLVTKLRKRLSKLLHHTFYCLFWLITSGMSTFTHPFTWWTQCHLS